MKKTLLTFFCALTALFAAAQTQKNYTEPMIVTVDGTAAEPTQCNVTIIDNGNNTIIKKTLNLRNDILNLHNNKSCSRLP